MEGGFKPNLKPFRVSGFRSGFLTKPENPFGFQTEGFKPNLKLFRLSKKIKPNPKPFGISDGVVHTKPETLSGFRRGGLNRTRNPFEFQKRGFNQTRNPFGFQTWRFKPNL